MGKTQPGMADKQASLARPNQDYKSNSATGRNLTIIEFECALTNITFE